MMKLTNTPLEKIFKVQKWITGWGWATIGITPYRRQAEEAVEILHKECKRARVVEEEA